MSMQTDEAPNQEEAFKTLVVEFQKYVLQAATLLFNERTKSLETVVGNTASQRSIENFVKSDDTVLVLQKLNVGEEESKNETMSPMAVIPYEFLSEIPADVFESNNAQKKDFIIFIKMNERFLADNVPIPQQVIVSQMNSRSPFSSMLSYIRHSFVPVATMCAEAEENKTNKVSQIGIRNPRGQSQAAASTKIILEKLRDLEYKLLEAQDDTKMPDVYLEAIPLIKEWVDKMTEEEKRKLIDQKVEVINIPSHLSEQAVLNDIQKKMKEWRDEIMVVVRQKRPVTSTVQQEIKFWKAKGNAVAQIEEQLKQPEVLASTLVFLKSYPVQTRTFVSQVQVTESKKEVEEHNEILSTFPLNGLLTANNIQDIIRAISEIFAHLDTYMNRNNYPFERVGDLARAVARDVADQIREVLTRDVMTMKYSEFETRTQSTDRLFREFGNRYTNIRSEMRRKTLLKEKTTRFGPTFSKDNDIELNSLQKRVETIKKIRKGHNEIQRVFDSTFSSSDKSLLEDENRKIEEAYEVFTKFDVLKAPDYEWDQAVEQYEKKIQDVENEIQQMIRSAMENAKDPREMFRVCEKYNKLFVRDRIRAAVWDFQEELLKNVDSEVKELQNRYRQRYLSIPASRLSFLRDIPQVSGEVIWCRQLKRQLDHHRQRLEAVLGEKWSLQVNGKDLAERITSFEKKLDTSPIVNQWQDDAKQYPNFDEKVPIFRIDKGVGKSLSLTVNFDENYVKIVKEVRCLTAIGARIDIQLRLKILEPKTKYPLAVKLKEAISIFTKACRDIERCVEGVRSPNSMMPELVTLVDYYKYECQKKLSEGHRNQWVNHERQLNAYVSSLSKSTIDLQDKYQKAYDFTVECDKILDSLQACPLTIEELNNKIASLQTIIHSLDDGIFNAVNHWCNVLNSKLEKILLSRIDEVLDGWRSTLNFDWPIGDVSELDPKVKDNPFRRKEAIKHTIRISPNQVLEVQPSIADARMQLGQDLQVLLSMIVDLNRPKSDNDATTPKTTFRSILNNINTDKIIDCYKKIEEITNRASSYAKEWLAYQALWDMKLSTVFDSLGDDVSKWRKLLTDMKLSQGDFDSTENERSFGPVIIHFGSVRNKVDTKYNEFRKQTFTTFRARLGDILRDFHNNATRGKQELEETSFQVSNTKDIVKAVTSLQKLKDESSNWNELLDECTGGEEMLKTNRFNLGPTWMYASRIKGVLTDFFSVLDKRWKTLQSEAQSIFGKLQEQTASIIDDVAKLESRWHAEKPTQGWASTWNEEEVVEWLRDYEGGQLRGLTENFKTHFVDGRVLHAISKKDGPLLRGELSRNLEITDPQDQDKVIRALNTLLYTHEHVNGRLSTFENKISEIEGAFKEIRVAKDAMKVVVADASDDDGDQIEGTLDSIRKELDGLKEVHKELTDQWGKIQKIGQQKFLDLDSRELGKLLRSIEEDLQKLPNKIRTYQVYHKFMAILEDKKRMNKNLLGDLAAGGSENPLLRPKHWNKLFKLLSISKPNAQALLVDDVWSINLMKYLNEIREILLTAQGENALENFLKELDGKWQQTLFEMVDYKGKCALVKNWNDLMAEIADALSDVMSMKQSPFYKTFEREAIVWEEKLNSATAIFDVFVDVQRRWVYLQGVFTNSEDVQRELGYMFQKFKAFNNEFISLMKGIKQDPLVDHWVTAEQALLSKLEQNQNTLNAIQKALNEYLQNQRTAFARFYFVGDDDLLEIIGNSRDPIQMNKHLCKMFAGITQLKFRPDNDQVIIGMASSEGEAVMFKEHIDVSKSARIQDWLTQVEHQMRFTLASLLEDAISSFVSPDRIEDYFAWVGRYPSQVALLGTQVRWSELVEGHLKRLSQDQSEEAHKGFGELLQEIDNTLDILANRVLRDIPSALRKLFEQLITELVYQRDTTRELIKQRICRETDFSWLYRMRFYWNRQEKDVLKKLEIRISRAKFYYGFEYFGATERLVQTPLTDKAYLTLCEALHAKLGGNPFGPAGTGKTETVKALGAQLGRFVLVFCCDETFDYNAMSRIFVGLCQCGAWGCFDEFNRLEEKILSAVSQQILTIQTGLREESEFIKIRGENVRLHKDMGIFVTMNPGYAGRSELPDNLKQLFRGMAMIQPNRVLIAQVMLFSQGFRTAEGLSSKIVLLFELCHDQLSKQSHYDFGLRALKAVLRSAGNIKRSVQKEMQEADESKAVEIKMSPKLEETILIRSFMSTVVPKLVQGDKFLFDSLMESAFPGADVQGIKEEKLKQAILDLSKDRHYRCDESWLLKLMQLNTISNISHGVMLVGPSGSGKSSARNVLTTAMERVDGIKTEQYDIDPKAINKEQLYGILDPTTLEWTDGVFTATLRMILDNVRGESTKRHWIVFDGDVDPEWAENLNSVLDDSKMLTLPNGERLALTPNIRIIFETPNLNYATPATVSRCGMVWFSEDCVTLPMLFHNQLELLRVTPISPSGVGDIKRSYKDWDQVQKTVVDFLKPIFEEENGIIIRALEYADTQEHVMKFTKTRAIWSLFSQLRGGVTNILEHNENSDYGLTEDQIRSYIGKYLLFSIIWAFGGPMKLDLRQEFGSEICRMLQSMSLAIEVPDTKLPMLDYEINVEEQRWVPWKNKVSNADIEPPKIKDPTVVINTIDTIRHEEVIRGWLADNRTVILCGPPGSGKSMTLSAVLRANPQYEMITLNFSSSASTELIFKAFEQYCKIERKNQGYIIRPTFQNKKLVIFCDECNLPAEDKYGTQTIITFLRQILEKGGYWHPVTKNWIKLENIQFVGACNPPTDAGRVVLSPRFLNLCPLVLVDFPGRESLLEIYGTFIRALFKLTPNIRNMSESFTTAMVDIYQNSQKRFNTDIQPHYVYSPRELSRWTRALYRALADLEDVGGTTGEEMVRLWAHEALRLFSDRLVNVEERQWTWEMMEEVAKNHFGACDLKKALSQPILYSDYLSKSYVSVDKDKLKEYIMARLKVFNEEELDVQLVIYNELLDHILRIDRVLRQPLGHLLMVGASGAGKTVFSRFVSWLNNMTTFQIKVHKDYKAEDFDADLRNVLISSGVEHKKITFIFDESNILDTAFLERMNALLASGEVPGLFEDSDYQQLMTKLREAARRDGLLIDTEEELYQMFCRAVQNNLHIVFTMNPAGGDFSDRAATSPALFNRCVINWWGTWPEDALLQVAREFTHHCDLQIGVPAEMREEVKSNDAENHGSQVQVSVAQSLVQIHQLVEKVMDYLAKNMYRSTFVTPRHYLDLINHFVKLFDEKRLQLEDQQKHLSTGLRALKETEVEVARRQVELDAKQKQLTEQQDLANQKLQQMMESEKDATKRRTEALRVETEVNGEMKTINERSDVVEKELAEAKPALEAAKEAVSNINRRQLEEIKALRKPPELVEMTMKAVCIMMSKKADDWAAIGKIIGDAKFIPSILNFDTSTITEKQREKINKECFSNENFNYDRVNNSSRACGPLVLWIQSQVKFAHLLDSVEPMQKEIKDLRDKLKGKQTEAEQLRKTVNDLEKKIEEYKAEYQRMVQRITELKNEMEIVVASMKRAKKLLTDLSDENIRWQAETANFQKQLSTLVADCLLAAGFLTYIGYYNITYREILIKKWKEILSNNRLPYNENMDLASYLSSPGERIAWKAAELPEDSLCVENAIILKRFNRYPLVVDPSGQATTFLLSYYKTNKIVRTSFLNPAFLKDLESGLRFGNALLIEDVENMDPILNPVLNKEYQTVGGRKLIRLANKDIDFSPSFSMYLVTRDPSSGFTPDLCSRVTFVNFSVTPSSLQSQCLSKILRSEAPDIDSKRNDQLRLQGEFKFQLRELEDQLLNALNSVSGNILDDSKLMGTLEELKEKAKLIAERAADTEKVLMEIEQASQFYTPFAKGCSKLYFSLENLSNIHFLYQMSLRFFLDIVEYVLKTKDLPEILEVKESNREARLIPLLKALHRVTYLRAKRSLLVKDHTSFGLRVAQVFIECYPDTEMAIKEEYLQFLLKGQGYREGKPIDPETAKHLEFTSLGGALLGNLYAITGFEKMQNSIDSDTDAWAQYRGGPADAVIPNDFETGSSNSEHAKILEKLMIQKVFRPDQMIRTGRQFIEQVFNWDLYAFEANEDKLRQIVELQIDEETPIMMASTPGNDPSSKINQLAADVFGAQVTKKYEAFAMGSPEDYDKADNAIVQATKKGSWVCLKNVHLSPQWLSALEKKLHRLQKDKNFRLFMTMEIHPKVPATLLRKSKIIIYEPPLGIKASLQRTFNNVSANRVNKAPEERSRLYILLAWLHAVVLERLRFEPIGWSKGFEFSETDLYCAMDALDEWVDRLSANRSNIDPNEIPWDAIHKMLVQFVYGGRIDNAFDTGRLTSFTENLFTTEAFNSQFALASICQQVPPNNRNEVTIGRLGYVYPLINAKTGEKLPKEMLARIAQSSDDKLKIVFLDKHVVVGKKRISLNSGENWIAPSDFRPQPFEMQPAITVPLKTKFADIQTWVQDVDDGTTSNPAVIGLPPRAELLILANRAAEMCAQWLDLQDVETGNALEELSAVLNNTDKNQQAGTVPAWMKALRESASKWKENIPEKMSKLKESPESIKNPLFRFMRREFLLGGRILTRMNEELTALMQFVDGEIKATNDLRQLFTVLSKEQVPKQWALYTVDNKLGVTRWIVDFVKRIQQLQNIGQIDYVSDPKACLWLGGLFSPEGFIAATRQYVAAKNKWPLESLRLNLEIGQAQWKENSFIFEGLTLYGAGWDKQSGCLVLTEKTSTALPASRFVWAYSQDNKADTDYNGQAPEVISVPIPVYLNATFKELLFSTRMPVFSALPNEIWTQRAVSISVWST